MKENILSSFLAELAEQEGFNFFITLSFVGNGMSRPLWKQDYVSTEGLVRLYIKNLSFILYGRTRKAMRDRDKRIPSFCIPECMSRWGEPTYLHYHCLIRFPLDRRDELEKESINFWNDKGNKHFGFCPSLDIRPIYDTTELISYCLKNEDNDFTIQNSISVLLTR